MLYSIGVKNHRTIKDLTVVFTERNRISAVNDRSIRTSASEDAAEGRLTLGAMKSQPLHLKRAFYLSCSCISRLIAGERTTALDIAPNVALLDERGMRETVFSIDMRVVDRLNSMQAHRARYEILLTGGFVISEELVVDNRQIFRSHLGKLSFFGLSVLRSCHSDIRERFMPHFLEECVCRGDQNALAMPVAARLLPGYLPLAYSSLEELKLRLSGLKAVHHHMRHAGAATQ
ncbi:MAG: hypothetical protein ACI4NA_03685, partial [Succinivibrio sp.]